MKPILAPTGETVLLVEDDRVHQRVMETMLTKKLGYQVMTAPNGKVALSKVQSSNIGEFAVVLLDINMPDMDGFETLQAIRKYRPDLPVIMLTANDDTGSAVKAIKQGASDFIVKPASVEHVGIAIQNAIRLSTLSRELNKLKRDKEGALLFTDLIGHNHTIAEAVALGRKAAASNVPVLLTGETGVGKELFARAIHGESKRVGRPFVALNCSAIPETQVEAALFAPDKGAFRKAEGGTLFLDDIRRLPKEAQVHLLRVLQHKEIEPQAGGKPFKVNVRVIAATERDLAREAQAGAFREDLYFRLSVLPIHLPPLRERKADMAPLAQYFIERISAAEGLPLRALADDALSYLHAQAWPGNVRELENLLHRSMVLAEEDTLDASALQAIHDTGPQSAIAERRAMPALHLNLRKPDGAFKPIDQLEAETMQLVLAHFGNNITEAAHALGMAKSTFYRKMGKCESND